MHLADSPFLKSHDDNKIFDIGISLLYHQFRLCITKASGKAHTPTVARILRLPCVKGAVALATEGLFLLDFFILQSLRQPSAATSLYTREAFR